MSSEVARIRGFLIQKPKPVAVRVTGDGEPEVIKPGKSYQRCAETIAALDPQLVECLDGTNQIIRAMDLREEDSRRSDAAPIPQGIAADPHALMITHFANLLHRAYEHSTEVAFGRLVDLTDRLNDRSEAIEQRLERAEAISRKLYNQQIEDALDRADEAAELAKEQQQQSGLGEQMLGSLIGGMNQRAAVPRTNGKSNGRANGKHD